jgi:hypothetical protein
MPIPPQFNERGYLPPGDYEVTLTELRGSLLVQGSGQPNWDSEWRAFLVDNLAIIVRQLWQAGLTEIFVNGSFVEERDHPNDIDIYFECDLFDFASGAIEERLNAIDPMRSWTWDDEKRKYDEKTGKAQLPMWHHYHVEAWPDFGQGSTVIHPITKQELTHPELFRITRIGANPKGILKIIKESDDNDKDG